MAELKLTKLPDREPVRITIAVSPDLSRKLEAYANAYQTTYGEAERVGELIPFMLERFIASDRKFAKLQKETSREEG